MPDPGKNHNESMSKQQAVFLRARWEYLAMINYEVDPSILKAWIPPYTELDLFNGKAIVSVVGFLFNQTKVLGIPWPAHVNFEEVNLRLYIRYFDGTKWKRGVAFVSEIVPKPMVTMLANLLYNEHYSTAEMNHHIHKTNDLFEITYNWKRKKGPWNQIQIKALNCLEDIQPGSEEEFIFEHYFGYNELNSKTTIEYSLQHPRWQIFPVQDFNLQCDIIDLYGESFVPYLRKPPLSVFLAKGSEVSVHLPVKIREKPISKL
jgi:uncharacterized protein YqjF (DUF2071 family)